MVILGVCNGGRGMPKIPPHEKLFRNPTATERDRIRNADDAHGIRTLTEQTTHGNDVDETLRTATASQRKTERGRRLERMRRELAGATRTSSRPRPKPPTDAAVLLPDLATVPADAPGLRADRLEAGGRFKAASAGGELAEEIVAD